MVNKKVAELEAKFKSQAPAPTEPAALAVTPPPLAALAPPSDVHSATLLALVAELFEHLKALTELSPTNGAPPSPPYFTL